MYLYLCIYFVIITLNAARRPICRSSTWKQEDRDLKKCLGQWNIDRYKYVFDLPQQLIEANLTRLCSGKDRDRAERCVTAVPVHRCLSVLLFWRHVIDPINYVCDNRKDFETSLKCLDKNALLQCNTARSKLRKYNAYDRQKPTKNCRAVQQYKDCLRKVGKTDESCTSNIKQALQTVIVLHIQHLSVYNMCAQEYIPTTKEFFSNP